MMVHKVWKISLLSVVFLVYTNNDCDHENHDADRDTNTETQYES